MPPAILAVLLVLLPLCLRPQILAAMTIRHDDSGENNTAAAFVAAQKARGRKPNRLITEKSPYLLQHAFNPVDWHPWGEDAFARARREDKPVFLSIGYSTCHWCHVMAHESFESVEIAAILNRHFICIKVDREERPDIDELYMTAARLLSGGGGWPLSLFLTPALKPFYAGTYFPAEPRYGRPGFMALLESVHHAWQQKRGKVVGTAALITERLQPPASDTAVELGAGQGRLALTRAFAHFADEFDPRFGGFGRTTKFPRPMVLQFLLRYYHRFGEARALDMVVTTLRGMASGGIHDQVGGGFHRYSVDEGWRVPHFEKMLYDQAQLAVAYLESYQVTGDQSFAEVARRTLDYVEGKMTDPANGGFYSAEDADSPRPEKHGEHGEGAFYVWSSREIDTILGQDAPLFRYHYGVETAGNVTADPHHEFTGLNILHQAHSLEDTVSRFQLQPAQVGQRLAAGRQRLMAAREKRPRPHLDDKIITAWNGLMIGAFANASQVLEEPSYLQTAARAAAFVLDELYDRGSRTLFRRFRDGEAGLDGQLSDYVFLIKGLLDLYEASFDNRWLLDAVELTDIQIELFRDKEGGDFFDTTGRDPAILARLKSSYDGAEPAGNSLAALNLLRLAQLTGRPEWEQMGRRIIEAAAAGLKELPTAAPQMLAALDFNLDPPRQVVIAGRKEGADTAAMLQAIHRSYLPSRVVMLADPGVEKTPGANPELLKNLEMLDGKATAYVCENYTCRLPTTDIGGMLAILQGKRVNGG